MKLNIGIVPFINKKYDYLIQSVDARLIKFLNFCYKDCIIHVLVGQKINLDLIVFSGSNTLKIYSSNHADKLRDKIDRFYLKLALRKKIPVIGICHGAQFIAKKYKAKITKSPGHIKTKHKIIFKNLLKNKKNLLVNSFHNYIITKISNKLIHLACSKKDNSVEYFEVKNKKIKGIMWHPERNLKFSLTDKSIFRSIL
jgi:putative glutamine amidotransferase